MCSCTHTLPHTHRLSQTMAEYHVCATPDNVTLTPTLAHLEEFLHSCPKQGMYDQLEMYFKAQEQRHTQVTCILYRKYLAAKCIHLMNRSHTVQYCTANTSIVTVYNQCNWNYKAANNDQHNNLGIPTMTRPQSLDPSL